jgi:hypothetical protein
VVSRPALHARPQQRTPNVVKLHLQFRGSCPRDPDFVIPNWYREFEVVDKATLEQLASIILKILNWREDHLFEYKIKDRDYVHFGFDDDYFVDSENPCFSCDIPVYLVGHTFRITVSYAEIGSSEMGAN